MDRNDPNLMEGLSVKKRRFPTFSLVGGLLVAYASASSGAPVAGAAGHGIKTVPFGEAALIETAVLRATGILLSADERLRGISQPDTERWQVDFAEYGPEGETVPVVTVTPSECGLSTNLLLLTTKRVYSLNLHSAACTTGAGEAASLLFDDLVRFRYPEEELTRILPVPPAPAREVVHVGAPLETLVANASRFRWVAKNGYRGPKPTLVTEDEHSTYLVFPSGSWRTEDLPLFFLVNETGERELANFHVSGTTFLVRTRFEKAVLVAGGRQARKQPYLLLTRVP